MTVPTNGALEDMANSTSTIAHTHTQTTTTDATTFSGTTVNGLEIISMCTGDKWAFCLTVGSIGFAAALFLVLLVMMLHCCRKRCCKKSSSPSDSEVDRKKQTEYADPKNGNTLNPHSSEKLGSNTGQHPVTYELISESVSPYEEATGPKETTNTSSLYAEVAADRSVRSRSMKKGNAKSDGRVSTMKIEATGDVGLYDDAATINAALNPKDNTSNDYEFATAVGDTVAPVYCDATKMKETTTQSCTKDQKPPRSPFAMNHANTMKSPGNKFSGLRPDSGNDIYDDAAIVNMNRTEMNEDSQYDDGGDVYQEASTVKLEKLDDSKYPSDGAKQFQAKLSNDQSKGGHGKHGKEMDFYDEDLTLVENGLYGQHKAK